LIEQIFSEHAENVEKSAEVLTPAERVELMKALSRHRQAATSRPMLLGGVARKPRMLDKTHFTSI
jgi:hypothetical protein